MTANFTEIIRSSLGLKEPWYVRDTEFVEEKREVHIYLDVCEDAELHCPLCGRKARRCKEETNESVLRHGDCMFFWTYVHFRRPGVMCRRCGIQHVNAPL